MEVLKIGNDEPRNNNNNNHQHQSTKHISDHINSFCLPFSTYLKKTRLRKPVNWAGHFGPTNLLARQSERFVRCKIYITRIWVAYSESYHCLAWIELWKLYSILSQQMVIKLLSPNLQFKNHCVAISTNTNAATHAPDLVLVLKSSSCSLQLSQCRRWRSLKLKRCEPAPLLRWWMKSTEREVGRPWFSKKNKTRGTGPTKRAITVLLYFTHTVKCKCSGVAANSSEVRCTRCCCSSVVHNMLCLVQSTVTGKILGTKWELFGFNWRTNDADGSRRELEWECGNLDHSLKAVIGTIPLDSFFSWNSNSDWFHLSGTELIDDNIANYFEFIMPQLAGKSQLWAKL